jgi:hypothetical protein
MSTEGGHEMNTYAADYASTNQSPTGALRRAEIALAIGITAGIRSP